VTAADPSGPAGSGLPAQGPLPLGLGDLPPPVRLRVVALAAEVLPAVADLPGPLRHLADFSRARRARLGGQRLASALVDAELRGRVATQVAAAVPDDAPLVDRAALLWLEGRDQDLAETLERWDAGRSAGPSPEEERRRQDRLEAAVEDLRGERRRRREQVAALKDENQQLRRRLGESRAAAREARARAEEAEEARAAAEERAGREVAGAEAEARRMRERVEELQRQLTGARARDRAERDVTSVRARMLLDTVLEAADGLRRELALPPATATPGERVEEGLDADGPDPRGPAGRLVTGPDADPAALDLLLGLPRARLLVDGYNVSKTAWPDAPLEKQRALLVAGLAPLVARRRPETTVVFDAAHAEHRPSVPAPRGVRVVFSPAGVLADDLLRELAAAEPRGRPVAVVTSDREVATDVARSGARVWPATALVALLPGTGRG
jgi:predicted RNA-binding protein with PIN domain